MNKPIKIAFYDYYDEKVRYVTDIEVCSLGAKKSTKLELLVDGVVSIPIDKIVDTDLYNVGSKEMAQIMMLIDEMFERTLDESKGGYDE